MKKNNFAGCLTIFLTQYLPNLKNVSPNTISSYCDTFRLFLLYCRDSMNIKIEVLQLSDISAMIVEGFLEWLNQERKCSISTRNQRLAAFHSFIRYAQAEEPLNLLEFQKILDIPMKKKETPVINYLSKEDMRLILNQPDITTSDGRRDATLLSVLYDTAARVQEICDLRVRDIRFEFPSSIRLTGKGRKIRDVPILTGTVELLKNYVTEQKIFSTEKLDSPLFTNRHKKKLTRAGVTYILNKYVSKASTVAPYLQESISPHVLRHTKAMHLYDSGENLVSVRDILGHSDIKTTGIYARASLQRKRRALEKISDSPSPVIPSWINNPDLLMWLKNYGKGKQ